MIVEFIGPSCAGKSTLLRSTWKHLQLLGVTAHRHRADLDSAEYDPERDAGPETKWLAANPGILDNQRIWVLLRSAAYVRTLSGHAAVHLVDGGPLKHYSYGLSQTMARYGGREALATWLPLPDVAVLVDCDPELRVERLRESQRRHAKILTDEELYARHEHSLAQARWVRDELRVPLFEVDTTHSQDHSPSLASYLTTWHTT